jgi:soluble lytic murein transglycosylase
VRDFPDDTAAAAGAMAQLIELTASGRRDAGVRELSLALARRYPTSDHAARARFQAAILAMAAGKARAAAEELDTLLAQQPHSAEAVAARYWSGRAWDKVGERARAEEQWHWLVDSVPLSYYASLAAHRLGVEPWTPPAADDETPRDAAVDSAFARSDLLEWLGMNLEARLEYDELQRAAGAKPERLLAVGQAFHARRQLLRATAIGRRAVDMGVNDARAYRLLYPLADADIVAAEAAELHMDPALIAAIIRQESQFDARAASSAGARGLMQIMPRVGRAIARAEDMDDFAPAQLFYPELNIHIGVTHLKAYTGQYDSPLRALAAYNAGSGRVARWSRLRGARDPELFVERIPFRETRDYVRTVTRSRELYRALYAW